MNYLYYDTDCKFCSAIVHWYRKRTPKIDITYLDVNEASRNEMVRNHFRVTQIPDSVLFIYKQKTYAHSDAVIQILKSLQGGWRWLGTFIGLFPRNFRDSIYNFIAKNRHRVFGKKSDDEDCGC